MKFPHDSNQHRGKCAMTVIWSALAGKHMLALSTQTPVHARLARSNQRSMAGEKPRKTP